MLTSKISRKSQVTIPKKVRQCLHAEPGDLIEYEIHGDRVTLHKVGAFDREFHEALSHTLSEWKSESDEEAFRDL